MPETYYADTAQALFVMRNSKGKTIAQGSYTDMADALVASATAMREHDVVDGMTMELSDRMNSNICWFEVQGGEWRMVRSE